MRFCLILACVSGLYAGEDLVDSLWDNPTQQKRLRDFVVKGDEEATPYASSERQGGYYKNDDGTVLYDPWPNLKK